MKNILKIFTFFLLIFVSCAKTPALTFDEAFAVSDKKPMLVLIYADWADSYQDCLKHFRALKPQFENTYNFVELDIASDETKSFNARYHIYPNLPYVLMFRDRGKVSRYLQKNCVLDNSCITSRIKTFIQ